MLTLNEFTHLSPPSRCFFLKSFLESAFDVWLCLFKYKKLEHFILCILVVSFKSVFSSRSFIQSCDLVSSGLFFSVLLGLQLNVEIRIFQVRKFKENIAKMDINQKTIEKLVISQIKPKVKNVTKQPENEQINTAVIKVLQGYDWTLVPAAAK